jgi:hypothetical protein
VIHGSVSEGHVLQAEQQLHHKVLPVDAPVFVPGRAVAAIVSSAAAAASAVNTDVDDDDDDDGGGDDDEAAAAAAAAAGRSAMVEASDSSR